MAAAQNKKPSEWTFLDALKAAIDGPESAPTPSPAKKEAESFAAVRKKQLDADAEYATAERARDSFAQVSARQSALDSEYAAQETAPTATPAPAEKAPAGEEVNTSAEDSFAAAIESTLARTRSVADEATTNIKSIQAGEDSRANMKQIGDTQRLAVMDQGAKEKFAAAEAQLPVETPFAGEVAEAQFNKAAAEQANQVDEAQLLKDFEVTHGGAFDANSSTDAAKFAQIREARMKNPKATPTQIALMIYRQQA